MRDQDVLNPEQDFNLLSLCDLLAARDHFHLHLVHKENVIATAVGKYRIRKDDPWPDKDHPGQRAPITQSARWPIQRCVRIHGPPSLCSLNGEVSMRSLGGDEPRTRR